MKKLALLFTGLSLCVATGCSDDNDNIREAPLVGVWQPIKEVVTTVEVDEVPVSDVITYTDCQKTSRWWFSTETTGKRMDVGDSATPGECNVLPEKIYTYTYDKSSKDIQIKYQGTVEPSRGKVVTLDDTTLNLAIREETQDPTVFKTRTYTFKRVNLQK
ncbi:lipocalin-like domain-containing protein [Chryseobacterium pennipullorum]|uniref:Lipocalin-like domain-containing protein n=1 Tax=Chryseobacterium pennipullorum TaxID=2258963 RepID=A0A3D9B146_9FLAO|nr:lipocalin family protein [Chryseobacterium pennipullorum]REC47037.1 hypothetical protein DRF67_12540 [Chryseobacterium pennipullorum]